MSRKVGRHPARAAWVARVPRGAAAGRFLAVLTLVAAGVVRAQEGEKLSLTQAVELARRNNPAVLESGAQEEAARQASREASLSRLPSIDLRETALRTDSPADAFGLQLMQERFSFPSFTATDPNNPDPLNNFTTQVEAGMPLFTGGQLSGGIRQAKRMAESAAAMREHTASAVELAVTEAYLNSLLAGRFVELAERARETTARHVQKAQDFYDAGMMVESDLLQAKVQLASMDENLIRARNSLALARAGLNRAMGVEQDRVFQLEDPAPADTVSANHESDREFSYEEARQQAMRARKDLLAVERRVEAVRAGIGRARGEYWPQLGLAARYAWNDDRFLGGHGDSYTVAAMAQWKLWNWGQTRARVSRSRSEYQAAREEQRSYEQQVEFELRQSWQGVQEARARCRVTAGAVQAAERALTIVEDRFGQGIARMTDLLDAETHAHEARVRDAQARSDLEAALRTLRFAVGLSPIPEETK